LAIKAATEIQTIELRKKVAEETAALTMAELQREITKAEAQQEVEAQRQKVTNISASEELGRKKAEEDQKLVQLKEKLALDLKKIEEETKNLAERTKAVTPDLIAALQRFADMSLAEKMAESMAPMALLGGKSVAEVLGGLLQGTGLEKLATGVALGTGLERLNKVSNASPVKLTEVTR
jgi:major vault protein